MEVKVQNGYHVIIILLMLIVVFLQELMKEVFFHIMVLQEMVGSGWYGNYYTFPYRTRAVVVVGQGL